MNLQGCLHASESASDSEAGEPADLVEVLPVRRPKRKAAEPAVPYEQLARRGSAPALQNLALYMLQCELLGLKVCCACLYSCGTENGYAWFSAHK